MTAEAELTDAIGALSRDPLAFVRLCYPWGEPGPLQDHAGPRLWQAEVLVSIGERLNAGYAPGAALMPVLEAVASGHGIGKSACVSWLVWWGLSTCPDAKVVITANTEAQLRTKTWPEIAKWARLAINAHWFKVTGTSILSVQPDRIKTWRADAVTWSRENLESFAGLHNQGKRIVLIFDEASGIADEVSEVAKGALTDEDTEIVWLMCGNPTKPSGAFYEAFNRDRGQWNHRQIDSRTVPGTNKALFDEWIAAYGEDSDFVRVRVLGRFPRAGSMQFIGTEIADAASRREARPLISDPLLMGVDVARYGDDQSVIAFRRGRDGRSIAWHKLRQVSTMDLAGIVADLAERHGADAIFVDGGGVGGGVVDRLRQLGLNPHDVQFGGKADRVVIGDGNRYANKRAEMWGGMRDWLAVGAIPDDADLRADLAGPQYGFRTVDGRDVIQLERKGDMKLRGMASPDAADALALTFAYPIAPRETGTRIGARGVAMASTDYDPYA